MLLLSLYVRAPGFLMAVYAVPECSVLLPGLVPPDVVLSATAALLHI